MSILGGLVRRTVFLFIFFGFAGFGFFLLSIGLGFLKIDALMKLYAISPDFDISQFIAPGVGIMVVSSFVFLVFAWVVKFDYKEIPPAAISRVVVQDLVLIVVDKNVFEKTSVEWANVNLNYVKREVGRNFFGIHYDNELFIKDQSDLPLRTEELVPASEENIDELDLEDLEMILDQDEDEEKPFELGTEEAEEDADKKKIQTETLQ